MPVQHLIDTYKAFGFGEPTGLGLTGESAGLMPHRRYWGQLDRATFAFGYGLMVTPLQLAHVYATIGGLRHCATTVDYPHRSAGDGHAGDAGEHCA